jgi:hypothetical protein
MLIGVVSQEVPSLTEPSGKVIVIGSRGFSEIKRAVKTYEAQKEFPYWQFPRQLLSLTFQIDQYGVEGTQEEDSSILIV